MESKFHSYTDLRNAIHRMLENSEVSRGSSTEHSLGILEQKWTTVYSKVQERKVRQYTSIMLFSAVAIVSLSASLSFCLRPKFISSLLVTVYW